MPQIFHPSANTLSRLTIFGAIGIGLGVLLLCYLGMQSPYQTQVRVVRPQPVPFSHEHHVRGLGIDCRYCHTSVESSPFAGLPPTYTCMSCHSQIWASSPMLEPVRASLAQKKPLKWTRVHDLPDFVYFNHAIHVQKGVGCVSCHGRVDKMPLAWKEEPMTMEWCLECHRHPENHLRDKKDVFRMDLVLSTQEQLQKGHELVKNQHIEVDRLTNCSVCHR
jgi:Cytochrome c7 and related cytochrome c